MYRYEYIFLLYKTRDIFNQRPLPFVIGSVEFMNSVDGGIGEMKM